MSSACEDCVEVKKLQFQVKGLDLVLQRQKIDIDGLEQNMVNRDVEHDTIIQGVATRMHNMEQQFEKLQSSVTEDIAAMRQEIPSLFTNAMNAMLAKIAKWLLGGILVIVLVIVLAFSRPVFVAGLQELVRWVQTIEVPIGPK